VAEQAPLTVGGGGGGAGAGGGGGGASKSHNSEKVYFLVLKKMASYQVHFRDLVI